MLQPICPSCRTGTDEAVCDRSASTHILHKDASSRQKGSGWCLETLIKPWAQTSQQNGVVGKHWVAWMVGVAAEREPAQPGRREARRHTGADKSEPKLSLAVQTCSAMGLWGYSLFFLLVPRQATLRHIFSCMWVCSPWFRSPWDANWSRQLLVSTTQWFKVSRRGRCSLPVSTAWQLGPSRKMSVVSRQSLSKGEMHASSPVLRSRRAPCVLHVCRSWWPMPEEARHNSDCC